MAIGRVGSIMTAQPQSTSVAAERIMEGAEKVLQSPQAVDKPIVVAENAQGKGENPSGEQGKEQYTQDQMRKAVEYLNKDLSTSEAVFGVHEGTNRLTIKIVDKETKEVIRELPPEKTLDMIAKIWEIVGLFVDEKR